MGKLIWIIISWSQFYSGVSYSILECPTQPIPHLVGKFVISVRNYLSIIGGQINITPTFVQDPLRKGDRSLMETAIQSNFSDAELKKINYVRLYLKVTHLSEICNTQGTHIVMTSEDSISHAYQPATARLY